MWVWLSVALVIFVFAVLVVAWRLQRQVERRRKMDMEEIEMSALKAAPKYPDPHYVPHISRSRSQELVHKQASNKFIGDVPCLISGRPATAATGLEAYLKVPQARMSDKYVDAVAAIRKEFIMVLMAMVDAEASRKLQELLTYILDEEAREIEERSNDAHSVVVRDLGNFGKRLKDFHEMEQSITAGLTLGEVAALRIYTSALFRLINMPFRDPDNRDRFEKPHELGVTVTLIYDGLKKLRRLHADCTTEVQFWRGLKDLRIPEEFELRGGTELQCMSTTADIEVAGQYGKSDRPLILCIHCTSFMNRGSDISWLSLYPHEKEILYPPLTYLKFLGTRSIEDCKDGCIVDVEPVIS